VLRLNLTLTDVSINTGASDNVINKSCGRATD